MPTLIKTPFPRTEFIPAFSALAPQRRVVYLIEVHQKLEKRYRTSYKGVLAALDAVKSHSEPAIMKMSTEQRNLLKKYLTAARDEVARGLSQTITLVENSINELAPGSFPRGPEPLGSFDLGDWIANAADWLADLLHDIADIFYDFGLDAIGEGLDMAADAVDDAGQAAHDLMEEQQPEPEPEPH